MSDNLDQNSGNKFKSESVKRKTPPDENIATTLTDRGKNFNECDLLAKIERQFRQLTSESNTNNWMIKNTQDNLNDYLKRNTLLEHELETERLNNSMIKIELETLNQKMNTSNTSKANYIKANVNVLTNDRNSLKNKLHKVHLENVELKQELIISNSQISSIMANQYKYSDEINLLTSTLNPFQERTKQLENESHLLIKNLCAVKILAKKLLSDLDYKKQLCTNKFNHIQQLVKEISSIKSEIHMWDEQTDNEITMENDQENTSFKNQAHLDICMEMIDALKIENVTLHTSLSQKFEKSNHKDTN